MAEQDQPDIDLVLKPAAHQSPPGWKPFERAGIAAPFEGRFHRRGERLPSYLAVATDLQVAAHAALDEFESQHDPDDPQAPSPSSVARRLSVFKLEEAALLVADAVSTVRHLGFDPRDIAWEERSSWGYCQEAADLAKSLSLDGVLCRSAVRPEDCRTAALFHEIRLEILTLEGFLEGTVLDLRKEVANDLRSRIILAT